MGADWSTLSGDPLNSGGDLRNDEHVERDREEWLLVNSSNSSAEIRQHMFATSAPEDLHVLPQDMDFLPQELQSDEDEWSSVASPTADWYLVADPT